MKEFTNKTVGTHELPARRYISKSFVTSRDVAHTTALNGMEL
jgi:hypothetical protein